MKRLKAACIMQTLGFSRKPKLGCSKEFALQLNRSDFDHYEATLNRTSTHYQIVDTAEGADGTLIVHVGKQYNDNAYFL